MFWFCYAAFLGYRFTKWWNSNDICYECRDSLTVSFLPNLKSNLSENFVLKEVASGDQVLKSFFRLLTFIAILSVSILSILRTTNVDHARDARDKEVGFRCFSGSLSGLVGKSSSTCAAIRGKTIRTRIFFFIWRRHFWSFDFVFRSWISFIRFSKDSKGKKMCRFCTWFVQLFDVMYKRLKFFENVEEKWRLEKCIFV